MNVRSLGFRTDLALLVQAGSLVEDHGDHLVVRTPDNPTYFWGNFVLFEHAPTVESALAVFAAAFPDAEHVSLGVDDAEMDAATRIAFGEAGVGIEDSVALSASRLQEPRPVDALVRPLAGDDDWEARAWLNRALEPEVEESAFMAFARRRNTMERALVEAGRGQRYGVFDGDDLVATAACFDCGGGLARYQSVETHPEHRRRGHAAAAVHAAGAAALEAGAERLVIVADEEGDAVRIYRRLGLRDTERQLMLERRGGDWAASG